MQTHDDEVAEAPLDLDLDAETAADLMEIFRPGAPEVSAADLDAPLIKVHTAVKARRMLSTVDPVVLGAARERTARRRPAAP